MKRIISLLLAFSSTLTLSAQIQKVTPSVRKTNQYGRLDVEVMLKGHWNNPYLMEEAALDMVITTPSGKALTLPCFHKSGKSGSESLWEARFTPQEKGRYSYVLIYSENGKEVSRSKVMKLSASSQKGHGILHPNDNWTLKYDDGTLFRGVGENICWESRAHDDSKFFSELHERADLFNYDVMLPDFANNGGNFVRVWMCSWNFPIDRKSNFNNNRYTETTEVINESAASHLDDLLTKSEKLGIHIMLTLGAGEQNTDHNFFTSDSEKTLYRNRLRYIIARWGYSSSIGMWEFFNEVDNIQFRNANNPVPAEDIVTWHAEMSKFLKKADPYGHIATTSISHRDLDGLNSVPDIDINQKHIYRGTSSIPGTILSYGQKFGKPYIVGEFSYEWDWSKNFDDFAEDMDIDFKRGLWYGLFTPTPVTPMSWWWEYFISRNMVPYFRNVRMINDMMMASGGGDFKPATAKAAEAETFAVRCGDRTFVYVYNQTENNVTSVSVDAKAKTVEALDTKNVSLGGTSFSSEGNGIAIPCNIPPKGESLFVIR